MNPLVGCTLTALLLAVHALVRIFSFRLQGEAEGKDMSQADETASDGQAGEGVDRAAQLMHRMDATQPTATFKKVMALTSAGVFVDAMDVYLAGGVKSTLTETGFATNEQTAAFLSAGFLGLFVGSLIAGLIGDKLGRRKAFQFNLLLFGFATILGALSPNMTFMIAMRFFVGLGLGSELVTSFSMINEFAPVARRGRWCAIGSTIANCGSPIGMFLCLFFITIWSPLGQESWRLVFAVIGVAAIIVCIARQAMPESPRWLIQHGRFDDAETIISRIEREMREAGISPAEQVVFEKSAMDSDAHLARNLFLGIVVVIGTSLTQYTYTTFGPSILKNIGLATQTSLLSTTITMLAAPLGALIGALLIEKLGRRAEVSGAFVWVAVFAFAYAMALNAGSTALITVLGFLMTIGFYVLNASVISVYVGELFSTKYRFRGAGISQGAGKAVNVVMPFAVTWILANLQPNVIYFGIVAIALVAAAVTLAIGPETKSRRLG